MGINQIVTTKINQISLNKSNGSFKIHDEKYIMYKNGTTIYHDISGRYIKHQFETLFMSNDLSHAILTSINGNRYSILMEENYAPTVTRE